MIDEKMGVVLRKLTLLSLALNSLIDAGQHEGITSDEVYKEVENKTIFQYLSRFENVTRLSLNSLTEEDKWHLTGEWQSMANAIDSENQLLVSNNGICLLLAYVIEGIQMRTFGKDVWPGPEPW